MKKRNLKTIKLNKQVISTLDVLQGGLANRSPLRPAGESEISYCSAGSHIECCA